MASAYTDLDRPPLNPAVLRRALLTGDSLWSELRLTEVTESTNADVAAAARTGAPEGLIVVAEEQRAGRGRLGRSWTSPPRAGLAVSVLLRPDPVPSARYGWLPLLAGVALAETVQHLGQLAAVVKWPNDLLIGGDKCAGILAETVPAEADLAVVVGIGLNVSLRQGELPRPDATSLALAGSTCTDRDPLLRMLLRRLASWYLRWKAAGGDPDRSGLRPAYRSCCATLNQRVRASLPGGVELTGRAADVDEQGCLVLTADPADGNPAWSKAICAGEVVHLR